MIFKTPLIYSLMKQNIVRGSTKQECLVNVGCYDFPGDPGARD
jgi:hypothetical protein